MGQTRVDLRHLLEDLRDAYPGEVEETILSEVVANALDSGAASIRLLADPGESTLVVVDDGSESNELGRLVESTVLVNTAHPAHRRAVASRSEGYHAALAVGMALAAVAVEPASAQAFLSTFLARWGETLGRDRRRRTSRPPRGQPR